MFYNWILEKEADWFKKKIIIEKIINTIEEPAIPSFPYVCVQHKSPYALGQIDLHRVHDGYIADFEAVRIEDEKFLAYHQEFSQTPNFDVWQERYVDFLCSK